MRKFLPCLLVALMLLGLCACGGDDGATGKAPSGKLLVGYGRANLSPSASSGVTLSGYGGNGGDEGRIMAGMLDPVYGTCVAITDSDGKTVLIYTVDTLYTTYAEANELRKVITEKTGIPGENMVFSGTHTHASVAYGDIFDYKNKMAQAAVDALADRAPATVQAGSVDIENMNYVRHYLTQNGSVIGDNFNKAVTETNLKTGHTTQADGEMPMIRYVREGDKKDILLVNWQAHPKVGSTSETESGRAQRNLLSADFIGFCRMAVEKQLDCHFAYYNGASGNLNGISRMTEERGKTPEKVDEYGAELARQLIAGMANLKDVEAGKVAVSRQLVATKSIISGGDSMMEITAIRVGDTAFATVPFEMFDTNGMQIKEGSPMQTTFVLTCAHMISHEYIPAEYVWDYNPGGEMPYELKSCKHVRGTAEQIVQELVNMLTALAE